MGMMERLAARMGYEKRSADPSWTALASNTGYTAGIGARAAENIAAVLACTSAISTALGSIPSLVYKRDSDGNRTEVPNHPLARLVRQGGGAMSWPELLEHGIASALLAGNGLIEIVRNPTSGILQSLEFIPWGQVTVVELPSGRLRFDVTDRRGKMRRLLDSEVLHFRGRTDDGLLGRSVLSRSADTVEAANAANAIAKGYHDQGGYPSGVITSTSIMNAQQKAELAEQFREKYSGKGKAGSTIVLDGNLTWQAAQISPEDQELLETRKFSVIEICRLFQVPPPIIQAYENNTFTNAATAGLWFAMFTLTPWARKIEAEFCRKLFPANGSYELEMDLSGFLRGDPETRWKAHQIAISTGVLDADEVRQLEGLECKEAESQREVTL